MKPVTVPRDADKFVTRMPDGLRERLIAYKDRHHTSINSVMVQSAESFLDNHEKLLDMLEGVALLRQSLIDQNNALLLERSELAEMKAQLKKQLEGDS